MNINDNNNKDKQTGSKENKGFFALLWESLTKTGGCCGNGEDCCSTGAKKDDNKKDEPK